MNSPDAPVPAAEGPTLNTREARSASSGSYSPTTPSELAAEFFFILTVPVAVALWGQKSEWMAVFTLINLTIRFLLAYKPKDEWFFLLGLAAGGGNDLFSMIRGVYAYTPPHLLPWPIPLWIFPFWGQVFLLFRRALDYGPFRGPGVGKVLQWDSRLAADLVILAIFKFFVYGYASHLYLPSLVGVLLLGARFAVLRPTPTEWRVLAITMTVGPAYEIILVKLGLYNYQHGYFFGLPVWLLVFWALSLLISKNLYDRMERAFGRPIPGLLPPPSPAP